MRRTFGLIVLLTALGSSQASFAQEDPHQRVYEEQKYKQQQVNVAARDEYRGMAGEARRRAERAKTPESKAQLLKMANNWDALANQANRLPYQPDR